MAMPMADKLKGLADRLATEVATRRARTRLENTPKRQREAMSYDIDTRRLDRIRSALVRLADAHAAGTVPDSLKSIKSKAELMTMLTTKLDHSGGYYSVRETDEYHDQSPTAVALRRWLEDGKSEADQKAEAERQRQAKIDSLIRDVRFAPIPGFFPTPPAIIEQMLDVSGIRPHHGSEFRVLEPSAGLGDIADAVRQQFPNVTLQTIEINQRLREILELKGHVTIGNDFLAHHEDRTALRFDCILMNPPFERGQDTVHVRTAYDLLRACGTLVSVMSIGPFHRQDWHSVQFREWFDSVAGERIDLPAGSFSDAFRETGTSTCLVVIGRG